MMLFELPYNYYYTTSRGSY